MQGYTLEYEKCKLIRKQTVTFSADNRNLAGRLTLLRVHFDINMLVASVMAKHYFYRLKGRTEAELRL